jgi:hypothetical protein
MCHFGRSRFNDLCIQSSMMEYYSHRVSPFGYLRVYAFSGSPKLFAGLRVLLRLSIPRHPPAALNSLITKNFFFSCFAPHLACGIILSFDFSPMFLKTFILKRQFSSVNCFRLEVLPSSFTTFDTTLKPCGLTQHSLVAFIYLRFISF